MSTLDNKVLDWFATGQVGQSSQCMALALTGHPFKTAYRVYPADPDDFNRCYKLLKAVPELRGRLHWMKEVNDYWKALVARWDEVEESLISEIGENGERGRAPLTYDLMQVIYEPVRKAERK